MKLENRERVDDQITIGHRVYYQKGKIKVSRRYAAEFRDLNGKQQCWNLGTTKKTQARRKALEIQQQIEKGTEKRVKPPRHTVVETKNAYYKAMKAKGLARKTLWKYGADLEKLKNFCQHRQIEYLHQFSENDIYEFRQYLFDLDYADKTIQGVLILTKQMFKWAWRQGLIREYRLAAVSFPKAKARPQPYFTTIQVEQLIDIAQAEDKAAFALLGYAGLRIGELEQLQWEDFQIRQGQLSMIHICRGGSTGTPKDKEDRFVPVHPKIRNLLEPIRQKHGTVFQTITERTLLKRLKIYCAQCEFSNPNQYKLHSFRHHFASLCANYQVAHWKALAWLGHSSSEMLDLYFHLHDEESQQAMIALAEIDSYYVTAELEIPLFEANW